jgi:tetratricopeptide (TPR) repeat protein
MRQTPYKPLLARLPALIIGLALSAAIPFSFAYADPLSDIQRLLKQGQMPQALEKVESYISSKPKDAQGRFLKGLILTEMGRPTDAVLVFTKLTEDYPELPEPYNNLAVLYAQQKQYDKARTALEMAIRTHPSYSIAHENLGDVYAKLASQANDKALQIDSSNAVTQSKMSLSRELISASVKPGKPVPAKAAAEPLKPVTSPPTPVANIAALTPPAKPAEPSKVDKALIDRTVEKTPETKVASPVSAKPLASNASEADIIAMLQDWASAWSQKDVKTYLTHYATDFEVPNGMSRKAWEAERNQRIDKPGKLQVNIEDFKISLSDDKAIVKFRQHYRSSTLKTSNGKTITLVKSGGKWLIQQERAN